MKHVRGMGQRVLARWRQAALCGCFELWRAALNCNLLSSNCFDFVSDTDFLQSGSSLIATTGKFDCGFRFSHERLLTWISKHVQNVSSLLLLYNRPLHHFRRSRQHPSSFQEPFVNHAVVAVSPCFPSSVSSVYLPSALNTSPYSVQDSKEHACQELNSHPQSRADPLPFSSRYQSLFAHAESRFNLAKATQSSFILNSST
jgi:hypothetical protein